MLRNACPLEHAWGMSCSVSTFLASVGQGQSWIKFLPSFLSAVKQERGCADLSQLPFREVLLDNQDMLSSKQGQG